MLEEIGKNESQEWSENLIYEIFCILKLDKN